MDNLAFINKPGLSKGDSLRVEQCPRLANDVKADGLAAFDPLYNSKLLPNVFGIRLD